MELLIAVVIVVGLPMLMLVVVIGSGRRTSPVADTAVSDRITEPLVSAGAADVVPVVERLLSESQDLLTRGAPSSAPPAGRRAGRLVKSWGLTDVHVDPERRSQGVLASMQWGTYLLGRNVAPTRNVLVIGRLLRPTAARVIFTTWAPVPLRRLRPAAAAAEPVDDPRLGRAWSAYTSRPDLVLADERLWRALVTVTPNGMRSGFGDDVVTATSPRSPIPDGYRLGPVTIELQEYDLLVKGSRFAGGGGREQSILEDVAATFIREYGA